MIVEVNTGGKQKFLRYFSTSLKVIINERYGELKADSKNCYVKVFAKHKTGEIKFFRDGYTDVRGRFEYAQINSKTLESIEQFAIFINSDEHGSIIKECGPPKVIEQDEIDMWNANPVKLSRRLQKKIRHLQTIS